MDTKQLLPFISNKNLYAQVGRVIDLAKGTLTKNGEQFYKNSVDPFSALFDALWQNISLTAWLKQEKSRQNQKTLQNALGDFHQEILGSFNGWESLGKGSVFDIKNESKKIIAEIKNKYNTTKGNHKVAIYDDLKGELKTNYEGYTAYYVEVIPKNKKIYDKPFTPSDNRTHRQRPKNKNIKVIDGKSFYALATGDLNALKKLYDVLPGVIGDILGRKYQVVKDDTLFNSLFERIY
ncbi:MAG: Eco47II family restriction endonuclease [bacterium]|nr:Eco47II family restriction endonuclease [bacterium]